MVVLQGGKPPPSLGTSESDLSVHKERNTKTVWHPTYRMPTNVSLLLSENILYCTFKDAKHP